MNLAPLLATAATRAGCTRWCRADIDAPGPLLVLRHVGIRDHGTATVPARVLEDQGEDRRIDLLAGWLAAGHRGRRYRFETGTEEG
jgi:hypothetical protein